MRFTRKARLLLLLTGILFLSMFSRLIFAPLLVYIREDLGLSQSQAGSLFLVITLGYSPGMLFSGYLTARVRHRGGIILSLLLVALGLFVVSLSATYPVMLAGLWVLGLGAGLYPTSGVATIHATINPTRAGQALAIHEMGPNMAYFAVPLMVLLFHARLGWRGILLVVVALNLVMALIYSRRGSGGLSHGKPPHFSRMRAVIRLPEAWFIFFLFCVALSAQQGIFSILPMFLVTDKGITPDRVNTLISLSRISGVVILFVSGALVDRFGARPVIVTVFVVSGIATVFVALAGGFLLRAAVIVQPALLAAFFPAGLMIVSRIGPPDSQNVTFSMIINFAVLFGNGIVPTFIGWLGDRNALSMGFLLIALATLFAALVLYLNRSFGRMAPPDPAPPAAEAASPSGPALR